jgi:hypothetical protein
MAKLTAAMTRSDRTTYSGVLTSGGSQFSLLNGCQGVTSVTDLPRHLGQREGFDVLRASYVLVKGRVRLPAGEGSPRVVEYYDAVPHMDCLRQLQQKAGFQVCNLAINGGVWTWLEIMEGLTRGIPTILLRGSNRATDAFIAALSGDWSPSSRFLTDHLNVAEAKTRLASIDRSLIRIPGLFDVGGIRRALVDLRLL